ncbi:formylglycine-generating enzyme family protein [Aeromicrobium wangtongii]|uniref:Formylglycine-generating enzyme family protein n=2 Tax=Aeromicrobium wangtongii TaxID=2969247 RepID=A0ABY5M842_9ACTN|nr:formylglycine-generating enzyme family protein [Aeromicrobium wangtongii]UUP12912.1 formylglycine-generating enzyme family protein [Aeromicrobium wangtongii]
MTSTQAAPPASTAVSTRSMRWIPGGRFAMGSDLAEYPEEGPVHDVTVDGFWMDESPVTVAAFRRFVKATGHVTVAERPIDPDDYPGVEASLLVPGSLVFTPTAGPVPLDNWRTWWRYVPGASWKHPEGPGSDTRGRELHPVVHVAWEDVSAYAAWAGKDLPTEAEWERAARGGLDGATYAWGDERSPYGRRLAKYWVGEFPWRNLDPAGQQRTMAVRSFPPNGYGLYDVTGNVWEWTSDFYRSDHAETSGRACCGPQQNPRVATPEGGDDAGDTAARIPRRVLKGGSHLCSDNYCQRYRPAARQAQPIESSMSHIGFRCILRAPGPVG